MKKTHSTTPGNQILKRCIFFDRDGIANQSPGPGYVERVEDFHILPEFLEALQIVQDKGYVAIIITNQRGVGLGVMSETTLQSIHAKLQEAVTHSGAHLLDIYYCTATENSDPMRKPNPGMLLKAAQDHGIDLAQSWMIGDNEKDALSGNRAGCRTILVSTSPPADSVADVIISTMRELPDCLRQQI